MFTYDTKGWQSLFTNSTDIYWYGNGYGRRRFVVLALDISHRNDSPLYSNYNFGDDRILFCNYHLFHPCIVSFIAKLNMEMGHIQQ
jgi:hypothetical protein